MIENKQAQAHDLGLFVGAVEVNRKAKKLLCEIVAGPFFGHLASILFGVVPLIASRFLCHLLKARPQCGGILIVEYQHSHGKAVNGGTVQPVCSLC